MSTANSPKPVSPLAVPKTHIQPINGADHVFEVLSLAEAMHVHAPCVFVACSYMQTADGMAPVDHYLSHTTHLARTLADPHLFVCLNTHGVTHIRFWREALSTRRKEMVEGMTQCKGACNQQLQQASR